MRPSAGIGPLFAWAALTLVPLCALAQPEPAEPPQADVDYGWVPALPTPEAPAPEGPVGAPATAVPAPAPAPVAAPAPAVDEPLPAPPPPAAPAAAPTEPPAAQQGFSFGSYGRVGFSTNLRGGAGRSTNVVLHGSRLDEQPYFELDLRYRLGNPDTQTAVAVATLAFDHHLFHYDGDFDARPAIRNLYLQVDQALVLGRLSAWAGSRMYRGDDIYLLDFWPLDNLNTLGAGIMYARGNTEVRIHVGVNRLDDEFQFQSVPAVLPGFGSTEVVWLDRQRTIGSVRAEQLFGPSDRSRGFKLVVYSEVHALGSGTLSDGLEVREELPSDSGMVLGAQVGAWGFAPHSFVNLFFRYATGLAAYGELAVPFGQATDKTTTGAREVVGALAADYELGRFALQLGTYIRHFVDADPNVFDRDDLTEFIAVLRPHVYVTRNYVQAFEVSYQAQRSNGLSPAADAHLEPAVLRLSVLPILSPLGWGTFTRPHLRGVYTLSVRNAGARDLENSLDERRGRTVEHYLGVQAEWWFNSSYR